MQYQNTFHSFEDAHGPLPYNMTNDYLFRAVLQRNNFVLCGLIRSLLHIPKEVSVEAEITNPIVLGDSISDKEIRLDISLILNRSTLINLEMQVVNRFNWKERSLTYLCRSFDQLEHGDDYSDIKPVIHIGFLDYTLFDDAPEFYASYMLMNVKNHRIYSDKFNLRVVDLNQTELATDEDKAYHIDYWAQLFKSTTWEELHMLAEKDEYISEATKAIFQVTTDAQEQKLLHDRREYNNDVRYYNKQIQLLKEARQDIASQKQVIDEQRQDIAEKDKALDEKDRALEKLSEEIAALKAKLTASDNN
ncbi:MAG: PD-(D/E)XK nuclease family transposase [Lachnospiraceae bacterium]|nr:PD-(D/E)XK nuclease family transposase [Lachnospiraceae bacterium]